MPRKTTIAAALALAASHAAFAEVTETVSEGKDREAVAVTIYNDNLALVREARKLPLNAGANRIALRDVSARIMPETASLVARSGAALQLLEQNFDYDLLSAQSLLGKYVGYHHPHQSGAWRGNARGGDSARQQRRRGAAIR